MVLFLLLLQPTLFIPAQDITLFSQVDPHLSESVLSAQCLVPLMGFRLTLSDRNSVQEQERTLERRVSELESDNQALRSQLEHARAEKDTMQRRMEEDGRRAVREVQDENAALRRDLELVRRAMEDLLNDRAGGRGERRRGGDASEGG